jgi:hypothetical protein
MDNHERTPAKIQNFSLAFQQMCSMGHRSDQKPDETARTNPTNLVLLPDEKISNEGAFVHEISLWLKLQTMKLSKELNG